ncbi:MAG: type II toxin-antitoxin system PemK/MazF family toxin [Patescibacteria group bacterium]
MDEKFREKYDAWNIKKQDIQSSDITDSLFFNEAEIWWCSLGINVGAESFGKGGKFRRPVLIVKKLSNDLCIVLPLTTKEKVGTWFIDVTMQGVKRCVLLYQIRMLHKKRFYLKMGQLDDNDMNNVKEKLEVLLKLSSNRHSAEAEIEGYNPKSNISINEEKTEVKSDNRQQTML